MAHCTSAPLKASGRQASSWLSPPPLHPPRAAFAPPFHKIPAEECSPPHRAAPLILDSRTRARQHFTTDASNDTLRPSAAELRVGQTGEMLVAVEQVSVGFLADHHDAIRPVSDWLVAQWGTDKSPAAVDEFADSLRSAMNRDRIPLQIVALVEQRVVGIAMLKKHELRALHPELTNWLGSVFVDPQFRSRRIASLLVEKIEQLARNLDIRVLHLQTEDLTGGLYARLGWKPSHAVKYAGLQRLIMLKELATARP